MRFSRLHLANDVTKITLKIDKLNLCVDLIYPLRPQIPLTWLQQPLLLCFLLTSFCGCSLKQRSLRCLTPAPC